MAGTTPSMHLWHYTEVPVGRQGLELYDHRQSSRQKHVESYDSETGKTGEGKCRSLEKKKGGYWVASYSQTAWTSTNLNRTPLLVQWRTRSDPSPPARPSEYLFARRVTIASVSGPSVSGARSSATWYNAYRGHKCRLIFPHPTPSRCPVTSIPTSRRSRQNTFRAKDENLRWDHVYRPLQGRRCTSTTNILRSHPTCKGFF